MRRAIWLVVVMMACVGMGAAQSGSASAVAGAKQSGNEAAVRAVLSAQQADWNKGDVDAFMRGYDDSPETTFVGKTVTHGYADVLARYKKNFATREQMGTLDFSDVEVRVLDAGTACVTGFFHLQRTEAGGGEAKGIFSLVFVKRGDGWKIVMDHTASL